MLPNRQEIEEAVKELEKFNDTVFIATIENAAAINTLLSLARSVLERTEE